jgi:hypothetical protein
MHGGITRQLVKSIATSGFMHTVPGFQGSGDSIMGRTDRADSAPTLFLTQTVSGLDIVDLRHRVPVDGDLKLPFRESEDCVDRHFEVGMLTVLSNQEVVRVDFTDMAEQGAIEAHHRGS